jgi:hypothetical protein
VVHIDEGFTFLGFDIRRRRKRGTSKHHVYTTPSKKAIASIKDKVKAKTYRSTRHMSLDQVIRSLNRSLAGWANYFRHGVSKEVFSAIDQFTWGRLMRWTRAKHAGRTGLSMKELRRRFCDTGWRFAHNGVVFTGASSVAVTRYRHRGSNIPAPWTLVANFVSFWARPAWRTRFESCVLHDHPAALRSSSSPRAGRRLELDVCGAAAVATAGAAGRRGGRGDVWRET